MKRLKTSLRYEHIDKEIAIYDFDDLSPEAQKNAIDNLRQIYDDKNYASMYMEMDASDLEKYGDGYFLGIDLKAMGIPIENVGMSWDWNYAWLCGTTTLDDFLKLCDYAFTDDVVYNIVNDYINDYEGGLDFEMEYSVDKDAVIDTIMEYFNYMSDTSVPVEEFDSDKQKVINKYFDAVFEGLTRVFDDFNNKVGIANKYLTRNMEGYLEPSDQDILEIMDVDNYEFDENGYII